MYNLKATIKKKALKLFTFVQALMKLLNNNEKWFLRHKKNETHQITPLFFSKWTSQQILSINHEVLLINCIYKTNKYKLSLFSICDVTTMNTIFYVVFCRLFEGTRRFVEKLKRDEKLGKNGTWYSFLFEGTRSESQISSLPNFLLFVSALVALWLKMFERWKNYLKPNI